MDVKIVVETKSQMSQLLDQMTETGAKIKATDILKRKQWRLKFAAPGAFHTEESDDTATFVTTRDISSSGLGFLSRTELSVGQKLVFTITTDFGEVEILGTVCHCTMSVGMYKIGVKFNLIDPEQN